MKERHVSIIIFWDNKKRILMQSRKYISKHGEEYGFFGGGIEQNETPEEAVKREVKEELNYDLKNFKLFKGYKPKVYGDMKITYSVFMAQLPKISKFKQIEGDSMKLFTIKEAKKLKLVERDYDILNDLEKFFNLQK